MTIGNNVKNVLTNACLWLCIDYYHCAGHMSSQSTNMVVLVDQGVDSLPSHEEQPVQETLQIAEGQVSGPEQSEKLQRRTKTRKKTEGRQILTCMWCSKVRDSCIFYWLDRLNQDRKILTSGFGHASAHCENELLI